jgi:hypothetical protein
VFGFNVTMATFDPANPLVAFVYIAFIAIAIRFLLIIRPLLTAYARFGKQGILHKLWKVKKLSALKGIERFLVVEFILLLLPLSVAGLWRFVEESPGVLEWTRAQFYFGVLMAVVWLVFDLRRSLKVRAALKPLMHWRYHPYAIRMGVGSVISTRERLEAISDWDVTEPEEIESHSPELETMLIRDEEGKIEGIDAEAIRGNVSEIGKVAAVALQKTVATTVVGFQAAAEKGKTSLDSSLQNKVNQLTAADSRRYGELIFNFGMVFIPILVIYFILPLLGGNP